MVVVGTVIIVSNPIAVEFVLSCIEVVVGVLTIFTDKICTSAAFPMSGCPIKAPTIIHHYVHYSLSLTIILPVSQMFFTASLFQVSAYNYESMS